MTLFAIRHKATGQFMPALRRRGYSHWNPGNPNAQPLVAPLLGYPRFFETRRKATCAIVQWACCPNGKQRYYGDEEDSLDITPDGRTKQDLEVVEFTLAEVMNG